MERLSDKCVISSWKSESKKQVCAAGRLIAVGGMTSARQRLDSVLAYDPREGAWAALPPMSVPRSSCGVAVLQGRLYVVGGNAGDALFHTSAEAFSVEAGRWRSLAPTAHGRSSLALAAV